MQVFEELIAEIIQEGLCEYCNRPEVTYALPAKEIKMICWVTHRALPALTGEGCGGVYNKLEVAREKSGAGNFFPAPPLFS